MKRIKTTSRLFEQICGVLGSLLCLISGSFILLIESGGTQGNSFLAMLAIVGAFIGFISSFYVSTAVIFRLRPDTYQRPYPDKYRGKGKQLF